MWKLLARILAWFAKKEAPELGNISIVIDGKVIPIADVRAMANAIPTALEAYASGQSPEQIVADLRPTLLTVGEDVANLFMPGAGAGIAVIAYILGKSRPMTQAETNAWMDRASQSNTSG